MKFDLKELEVYVENGLLRKIKHPLYPLYLYKYTEKCTFEKAWDNTLLQMRGIVLDADGNVLCKSFNKFFNNLKNTITDEMGRNPFSPNNYEVTEKFDGSLINVWFYNGEMMVTTNGSFDNQQIDLAKEIIENDSTYEKLFEANYNTYVFELIHPSNKIVIDYGELISLTLLAIIHTKDGSEVKLDSMKAICDYYEIPCVKKINENIENLLDLQDRSDWINKEGFVVKYPNGHRVKIKYKKYMELHKLVSGLTEKNVFQLWKDDIDITKLNAPDELYDYLEELYNTFGMNAATYIKNIDKIYYSTLHDLGPSIPKKNFAIYIQKNVSEPLLLSGLFAKFDNKPETLKELTYKYILSKI